MPENKTNLVTRQFIHCYDTLLEMEVVRSARQFAQSVDYLPQGMSEILLGRRNVPVRVLRKAVEVYQLNPVFLHTGEGTMFMEEEPQVKGLRILTVVTDSDGDERIVHVPVPAQAGYAGEYANPEFVENLPTYTLPDNRYKSGTYRSFDIAGDSMEPTLYEGDKVICDLVEPDRWTSDIRTGHVYVFVTEEGVLVKRAKNTLAPERVLVLLSDNDFYHPQTVSARSLREVWRVRAKISPFLPAPVKPEEELEQLRRKLSEQQRVIEDLRQKVQLYQQGSMSKNPTFSVVGHLEKHALEGGFWGITDESGRKWLPVNLDKPRTGKFRFQLREAEGVMGIFMWGIPVDVLTMSEL
jgi:phage repressor protein C with HTH and peptisase S24 domain/uncharacterized protein (DUF736 family)